MSGAVSAEPQAVFPFLVGCPRSGTTLLQALLDSHPAIAVPPESHFIPRLQRRFGSGWSGTARSRRFAAALFEGRRFQLWGISQERVVELIDEERPADVSGAVRLLFSEWARRAGKPGYADKTPYYVSRIRVLGAQFPEARFVHLIRDGRDVALSLAESFDRAPQTPAQAALYWSERVRAGREQGGALPSGRYLELRYEELVAEPEATVRRLSDFLEIPYDAAMLERAGVDRVLAGYPDPGVHPHLAGPISSRRDWRREMGAAERRQFELLAGPLLAELGYEVTSSGPADPAEAERARTSLLSAELEQLRHELFRARRQARQREARLERLRATRLHRAGAALARAAARLRGGGRT